MIFFMGPEEVLEDMLGNHTVHNHLRDVVGSINFPNIDYKINQDIYGDYDHFVGPSAGDDDYAMSTDRATDPPSGIPLFNVIILPKNTLRDEYDTFLSIGVKKGSIWKEEGSSLVRFRFYKASYLEGNENSELIPYYPMKSDEYSIYIAHEIRKMHHYYFSDFFYRTFKIEVLRILFTNPNYFDIETDYRSASCLHFAGQQEFPIFDASMFFPLSVMSITGLHPAQSPSIQCLLQSITHKENSEDMSTCLADQRSAAICFDMSEESFSGKRKLDQYKEDHNSIELQRRESRMRGIVKNDPDWMR
jgi:hypothetical protein